MPIQVLNGVRILDLTHFLAGPAATRLLGELGAEVIKVESIQRFDGCRSLIDVGQPIPYERSPAYNYFNTNKLGITLDLRNPRGVAVARELVKISDAVIDNFPPGTLGRLGLDEETLRSINPSLISISMPGYGRLGPWSEYRSFATSLAMMSGLYEITGHPSGEPATPSGAGVDPMNGVMAASALLMALMHRRQSGRGLRIDYAQLEATTTLVGEIVADCSVNGRVATRQSNRHPASSPHGIYPCRGEDTWLSIAVFDDDQFQALCRIMDQPQLAADPRFAESPARHDNCEELDRVVSQWTRRQDQYAAVEQLQAHGIRAGVVHSSKSVWDDPHLAERGVFEEIERPFVGKKPNLRPPLGLTRVKRTATRSAPTLGQDNHFVLADLLAMPQEEVADLERTQVIGTEPLTTMV